MFPSETTTDKIKKNNTAHLNKIHKGCDRSIIRAVQTMSKEESGLGRAGTLVWNG